MFFYLTYGDPPSGVYTSQVLDVVGYLRKKTRADVRLVAFISLHDFGKNKSKIQRIDPRAVVLPMLPKAVFWRFNTLLLALLALMLRPQSIVARNVIACNMALLLKRVKLIKKVCFDGRGAIAAEWKEYDVQVAKQWLREIDQLESHAVHASDFRIAVTEKLIDYWKNNYHYTSSAHLIIPCTLNSTFDPMPAESAQIAAIRERYGFSAEDVVLAYAGSTAGWQSFNTLQDMLQPFLKSHERHRVFFLSPPEDTIADLQRKFPNQITQAWVAHEKVPETLAACDMGILVREQSVTNRVASPTKFAEYLSAGLPVLISDNLGDYSEFTRQHGCGLIIGERLPETIPVNTPANRKNMIELVKKYFTKESFLPAYQKLTFEMAGITDAQQHTS